MAGLLGDSALKQAQYASEQACAPYSPTLRERLVTQKANLTQQLADLDAAISALDDNPNFENVLNVIGKVNHY